MNIDDVYNAATSKFGDVISVTCIEQGKYKVKIERSNPVFKDAPYMSITAYTHYSPSNEPMPKVMFCHGHYDLTKEQLFKA